RGAVPIVLATYPLLDEMDVGPMFFNVVFFVVLTSAIIQGTTISWLAVKLGLMDPNETSSPSLLELVSLGKTTSEINHIQVQKGMSIAGKAIQDIQLPEDILFTAIIREEQIIAPRGTTVIKPGDTLYVLSPKLKRQQMKELFMLLEPEAAP
ncbi:TrkA C-terminal domain-containing protein, partial [Paenibacillus maysiensis]|uniref:TrkA C-terminal domain-containing protein n=1 Tax=Paenibacillus maysiensis TaxID=1155954 RepID=UPI00247630F5